MQNILFSTISKKSFWACLFGLIFAFCSGTQALAYKTEQICESLPATAKQPAEKKCRTVRVKEPLAGAKDAKKDDKKAAKPAGGH